MPTVRDCIDDARLRHHTFVSQVMPDGAVLRFINERVRSTLLATARAVEPFLNESIELAATINGALVGVDEDGNAHYDTSAETGYAVSLDADAVPYIDESQPIAHDPFGVDGDTPGFPLPADLIRVTQVVAVLTSGQLAPTEVVDERMRLERSGRRALQLFVNGLRLIPIRQPEAVRGSDAWSEVAGVQLSYLQWAERTALADDLGVPMALYRVLVAQLAEWLALASKDLPVPVQRQFTVQRQEAERALLGEADAVLEGLTTATVAFRR